MSDSWCQPFWDGDKWLYGGAARNARIALAGGVQKICHDVATDAAHQALLRVEKAAKIARKNNVVALHKAA
ncbi:MAG: hypothetical protein Q7T36_04960 [Fluviicoccus sp.]|uniref:hypothetical protein n=1 Tax=Fluviicoccus sp. TaxID=2003552 RepID=UPI00271F85FC|nr:hypothetical protein [Fluviicoccus sp.]MDO8329803.1 hypothetical protein [Fluviicoccus sp.]